MSKIDGLMKIEGLAPSSSSSSMILPVSRPLCFLASKKHLDGDIINHNGVGRVQRSVR